MEEREAHIALSVFEGIGPLKFNKLLNIFKTAQKAFDASFHEYQNIGLGSLSQKLVDFQSSFDVQKYEQELLEKEITIVTRVDSLYPQFLKEIPDPPISIFVKGKLPTDWSRSLGVVGTRKVTAYGRQITQNLVRGLSISGMTIVSGLARGVDGIAHRTAIENGARTVAILGCGVDIIYPPEHKDLYHEIIRAGGAVISEVTPGHTVSKGLFPARNRIISGVSRGILVTEGAKDSGSLITAQCALDQGRDVFAVPGPITSYLSEGPVELIKSGAKVVTQVADILDELNVKGVQSSPSESEGSNLKDQRIVQSSNSHNGMSEDEKIIIDLLLTGEKQYDELIRESGLTSIQVGVIVTHLELSGVVEKHENDTISLT